MKLLALCLFFTGVVLIVLNELLARRAAPRVEYRYLPRDLDTWARTQPAPSAAFSTLLRDQGDQFMAQEIWKLREKEATAAPALAPPAPPAPPAGK